MKRIRISGICRFAGSAMALRLRALEAGREISGFDNFIRSGSELNRLGLKRQGVTAPHANVRRTTDAEALPAVDWVADAAANPRVSDIPRLALDSLRTEQLWDFSLTMPVETIPNEIVDHAQKHPDRLEISVL